MKFTRDDYLVLRDVADNAVLLPEEKKRFYEVADKIESMFKPKAPASDLKFLHYRPQIEVPAHVAHVLNLDRKIVDGPAISFGWTKPDQGKVVVGFCKQNPKDNFSRKIARSIIEGRINHGDGYIIEVGENVSADIIKWAQRKGLI